MIALAEKRPSAPATGCIHWQQIPEQAIMVYDGRSWTGDWGITMSATRSKLYWMSASSDDALVYDMTPEMLTLIEAYIATGHVKRLDSEGRAHTADTTRTLAD